MTRLILHSVGCSHKKKLALFNTVVVLLYVIVTHLVVAAEALIAPTILINSGWEPAVISVVLPPHTCQERRGENALPHGLCSHTCFDHKLCCFGFQACHVFLSTLKFTSKALILHQS